MFKFKNEKVAFDFPCTYNGELAQRSGRLGDIYKFKFLYVVIYDYQPPSHISGERGQNCYLGDHQQRLPLSLSTFLVAIGPPLPLEESGGSCPMTAFQGIQSPVVTLNCR